MVLSHARLPVAPRGRLKTENRKTTGGLEPPSSIHYRRFSNAKRSRLPNPFVRNYDAFLENYEIMEPLTGLEPAIDSRRVITNHVPYHSAHNGVEKWWQDLDSNQGR